MQRIFIKKMFPVYGGKFLLHEAVHSCVTDVSLMTRKLKRRCVSGWDNSQKTSMLRVLTHWENDGAIVSMLVEDLWRNKSFPGSNITCSTFCVHLWPIYWLFLVSTRRSTSTPLLKFVMWFLSTRRCIVLSPFKNYLLFSLLCFSNNYTRQEILPRLNTSIKKIFWSKSDTLIKN
jgi:hypothetical protein